MISAADLQFPFPGPIGAKCGECLFGPKNGLGKYVYLCLKTVTCVSADKRACSEYKPENGQVTTPFMVHR